MWSRFRSKFKQPISLRWKWGFLLFIIFGICSILGLEMAYRQASEAWYQSVYEDKQADFDQYSEQISQYISEEFSLVNNSQAEFALWVGMVEDESTSLRLYNANQQLVYETRTVSLPSRSYSVSLEEIDQAGHHYLVGQSEIKASNGQTLGQIQLIFNLQPYYDQLDQLKVKYRRLALIFLLVLLAISLLASSWFFKPLSYLVNALDLVEEESISDIRVKKPRSNDEWNDLSLHVNKLLDKIDNYVQSQKTFVEDASHELRTPVAVVRGHLELLDRWGKNDPEILDESISAALQETNRMQTLIQEMLDLSRAEQVDVDYKDEITEILSVVRQVVSNFSLLYPEFSFYLDMDAQSEEIYVHIFRDHFEQILVILIDNAVKYSDDRHEVHLSVSESFNTVEVAIQDFGIGMSESDKQNVFDRFYRIDKARSRDKGGNGLGLSIAKQLVTGYKGEIRVESSLGNGSIFYVVFMTETDKRIIHKSLRLAQQKRL